MKRVLKIIFSVAAIGGAIFLFRSPIQDSVVRLENHYLPCSQPITYSIGSFDKRFGISQNDFLSAIREAERIWEQPIGKQLFAYASTSSSFDSAQDKLLGASNLKINLIYDERQDATIKLRKYGLTIQDSKASYDAVQAKYAALKAGYTSEKNSFESRVTAFKTRKAAYDTEVAYWNSRKGAPREAYDRLNAEKDNLNTELIAINQIQDDINIKVEDMNAMVVVLNRLAATLNLEAAKYNQVGSANSGEFEEGLYQSSPTGQEIDIYQFDDRAKLIRVLAHEFGHALGLEHLTNPKAIMYRLNQGANDKLTPDDIAAMKKQCNIK